MVNYQRHSFFSGILYALGTNFIWSLAIIIPNLLPSFTSLEITLGRYFFYGILSLNLLLCFELKSIRNYRNIWLTAFLFAFAGNVGYYFFVVFGIKYVGAQITALVIGLLPITISLYANWLEREYPFSRLFIPILLIIIGFLIVNLLGINWSEGSKGISVFQQFLGLLSCFTAIILWTWYGVANSIFLKNHPDLSSSTWSTLVGVSTLFWVLITMIVMALSSKNLVTIEKYISFDKEMLLFLVGSLILGIGVSWCGTLLWNKTSSLLPISLAGQLIVLESIFALTYVLIADLNLPSPLEILGIIMIIGGVLLSITRCATFLK